MASIFKKIKPDGALDAFIFHKKGNEKNHDDHLDAFANAFSELSKAGMGSCTQPTLQVNEGAKTIADSDTWIKANPILKGEILYLCDRRACVTCSPTCRHTKNIRHAKNFEINTAGDFIEEE